MDPKKIKHFKELLEKEKAEAVATLESMQHNEPNDSLQEYFDELSVYDNHPADIGTETFQMAMNFNLKNNEKLHVEEIDRALEKINDGSYGTCITCGNDINEERLEILPTAIQCMECEKGGRSIHREVDTRPAEEDALYPPFGRTFKDFDEDYNGFDGEDAWQAVAQFNEIPNDPSYNGGDQQGYFDGVEPGTVEMVDQISEEYYVSQLEDEVRREIPDQQRKRKE